MSEPRFRPRPAGLRVVHVAALLWLTVMVLSVAALVLNTYSPSGVPLMLAGLGLLFPLLLGGQLHAYLGAPGEFGAVATPYGLWRHRAYRQLPPLPPLPGWKVALCYGVPLVLSGGLALLLEQDFGAQTGRMFARFNETSMRRSADDIGFLRVSCRQFPVAGRAADSLCFVREEAWTAGRTFTGALSDWTFAEGSWVELGQSAEETRMHDPQRVTFALQEGGGVAGGSQVVTLHTYGKKSDEMPHPYRLEYLTRTDKTGGAVPQALARQAAWLTKQPFHSYFMVTPLE